MQQNEAFIQSYWVERLVNWLLYTQSNEKRNIRNENWASEEYLVAFEQNVSFVSLIPGRDTHVRLPTILVLNLGNYS